MSLDDPSSPKSANGPSPSAPATPEPPRAIPPPPAAPAAAPVPPQIQDFDALIKGDVQNFVNLGEKIGGLVAEQVSIAEQPRETASTVSNWFQSPKPFSRPSKPSAPIFTL